MLPAGTRRSLGLWLGHVEGWELDIEAVSRVEWGQITVVDE
jgi:hypothetical protein